MLPSVDLDGSMAGRQMVGYSLALAAASLMPVVVAGAGPLYLAGALLLGIGFLACAVGFTMRRSLARARAVLRASPV
jgi:heme O synthase-like polyprenyltransferase